MSSKVFWLNSSTIWWRPPAEESVSERYPANDPSWSVLQLSIAMPAFRIPWTWGLGAFVLGALVFAYPLVSSPQLTIEDGLIMMRRSRWFLVVILMLAAVRLGLREYISSIISVQQTAGLFFVLAFGMIVRWRTTLLMEYRQLTSH